MASPFSSSFPSAAVSFRLLQPLWSPGPPAGPQLTFLPSGLPDLPNALRRLSSFLKPDIHRITPLQWLLIAFRI